MQTPEDYFFNCVAFGIKGLEPVQILKNISYTLARQTELPAGLFLDKLDQITKSEIVGIGDGVAVYDWKSPRITDSCLALLRLESPVQFPSVDDRPVDVIVVLVSAESVGPVHLRHLARITRLVRDHDFLARVRDVTCQSGLEALLAPENSQTLAA
ncbi:MAG: PTS sugar transporter subunit IIA [Pseudobdellovibrionaceae bacterium]